MIFYKLFEMLGLLSKKVVRNEVKAGGITANQPPSHLLAGFGAVMPKSRPEDFQAMREYFEESVAEDVVSEA